MLRAILISVFIPALLATATSLLMNSNEMLKAGNWHLITSFFFVLNLVSAVIYSRYFKTATITRMVFAGMSVKFILILVFILVVSLNYPGDLLTFSLHVIASFILFTIFEVRFISGLINKKSDQL